MHLVLRLFSSSHGAFVLDVLCPLFESRSIRIVLCNKDIQAYQNPLRVNIHGTKCQVFRMCDKTHSSRKSANTNRRIFLPIFFLYRKICISCLSRHTVLIVFSKINLQTAIACSKPPLFHCGKKNCIQRKTECIRNDRIYSAFGASCRICVIIFFNPFIHFGGRENAQTIETTTLL